MSMPKVLLDYSAAVALLEEAAMDLRELRPNEVLAAVTHWLQAQGQTPPYCDDGLVERWRIALQSNTAHDGGQGQGRYSTGSPLELNVSTASIPFPPPPKDEFTFSDLFAGIGGFRLALQGLGGRCVFACEWNKSAKVTYFRNFGIVPYGDIKQFTGQEISDDEIDNLIPYHDILTAGFPCQPFSLAGMPARNHFGIETGLNGSQGDAFFDLMRIATVKKPRALFLENVRNIFSIDHGNTFSTIRHSIEEELGYEFHYAIIDSSAMVPQRRKRLYIVALREASNQFEFPEFANRQLPLRSILQDEVPEKYTISDKLWASHIMRSERNRARGTGFTVKVAKVEEPSPTIVARYGKDGKECLIAQEGRNPRKLTPLECARLQGFPDSFVRADSDTASYRQFGNSVPVPVIERIGQNIIKTLRKQTAVKGIAEMALSTGREDIDYLRARVLRWGRQNFNHFPWRSVKNPWHALAAEIMLQRTKADQVLPVFMGFAAKYREPADFVARPTPLFSRLGLPIRDDQFLALNRTITIVGLPNEKAKLLELPGVGDYVASAFLSLHLEKRAGLIDANTVRVYGRFFGFETDPETRRKRWLVDLAEEITPIRVFRDYNYAIIDFSREICTPRKPQHEMCPLRRKCRYLQNVVDKRR